jgi:DNA-binding NarL/FixJ family response regulator
LFAAAERARADVGVARIPPEEQHRASIDGWLREALGAAAYEAARTQSGELTTEDALERARRAGGPRRRPLSGWASLTPSERKVAELAGEGLTNPQIGEVCSSRRRPSRPTQPISSRSSTPTAGPS